MRLSTLIGTLAAGLFLSACDVRVNIDLHEDATLTFEQITWLDEEACAHATKQGQTLCGGTNPQGTPTTELDPETGLHRLLPVDGGKARETMPIAEFADGPTDMDVTHDPEARIVTLRVPESGFRNISRGPASIEREPVAKPRVVTEFGGVEIFEGHETTFVVTAAEILESNGEISEDRTQVTFHIPAVFFALGMGDAPYTELYVKARY